METFSVSRIRRKLFWSAFLLVLGFSGLVLALVWTTVGIYQSLLPEIGPVGASMFLMAVSLIIATLTWVRVRRWWRRPASDPIFAMLGALIEMGEAGSTASARSRGSDDILTQLVVDMVRKCEADR